MYSSNRIWVIVTEVGVETVQEGNRTEKMPLSESCDAARWGL